MPSPMPDLCTPWDIDWADALAACSTLDTTPLNDTSEADRTRFLAGASRWLWWRTGRRYGECSTELTTEFRTSCTHRRVPCRCGRLDISTYGPVREVTDLRVNGDTLVESTDFELVGSELVRLPVGTHWPATATIEIEFTYGEDPPPDLLDAAGILAVNDALSCRGCSCELPERTKSISVEGLSIEVNNPDTWTKNGNTGIRRIDRMLVQWPWPQAAPAGGCDPAVAGSRFDRVGW